MAYVKQWGSAGDDVLTAQDGRDYYLRGFGGDDTLIGGDGNDQLDGGDGADVLIGGAGDDLFVYARAEHPSFDTLDGGAGYDRIVIFEEPGAATYVLLDDAMRTNIEEVTGNAGNDVFDAGNLSEGINLIGGAGSDTLTGGHGKDLLQGGDGDDFLIASEGGDLMIGDAGDDRFIFAHGQSSEGSIIDGGSGWDTIAFDSEAGATLHVNLLGVTGVEQLVGGAGDDILDASTAPDLVYFDGCDGNDVISSGNGNDYLDGGAGDDVLSGGDGWNSFHGGAGRDVMIGGDGGDRFIYQGNESLSDDVLDGGAGHDEIVFYTEAGAGMSLWLTDAMRTNIEQITGGDGNDAFNGLELTDGITLSGGAGFDYLAGSNGNDTLLGGDGSDFLLGWGGSDILTGGSGGDYFVMRGSGGSWIVTDFELGVDQVQIASTTPIDYDYVMQHAIQVGDNTEIHINDSVMVLEHVQLTGLSPASFSFDLVLA